VRNPAYWTGGEPYLDRIVIKITPDYSAQLRALQAGEVDYIDGTGQSAKSSRRLLATVPSLP
jgi:peptide/nickel transport system substrate-binding protein